MESEGGKRDGLVRRSRPEFGQMTAPTTRPTTSRSLSDLNREGAWSIVDQVLSSGTNFVPSLLLARVLGPDNFGAFSIAFLAWFGGLSILKSSLMQPYTLSAASADRTEWRALTRHA